MMDGQRIATYSALFAGLLASLGCQTSAQPPAAGYELAYATYLGGAEWDQAREVIGPFPPRHGTLQRLRRLARLLRRLLVKLLCLGLHGRRLLQERAEPARVEVHVGHRAEQGPDYKYIHVAVPRPELTSPVGVAGDILGRVDHQVLQRCGLGVFAAGPHRRATGPLRRLFTLAT